MEFGAPEHELQLKQYIISLLVLQAQSDKDFSVVEKKYLAHVSKNFGLSDAEVAAIRLNPEAYETKPPANEQERMNVLYYLLFMMRADKTIHTEEEAICYHVGFKLGFRPELVSDLVNVMRDCLDREIPPDAMVDRVKTYLN